MRGAPVRRASVGGTSDFSGGGVLSAACACWSASEVYCRSVLINTVSCNELTCQQMEDSIFSKLRKFTSISSFVFHIRLQNKNHWRCCVASVNHLHVLCLIRITYFTVHFYTIDCVKNQISIMGYVFSFALIKLFVAVT